MPEYYLTRSEFEVIDENKKDIISIVKKISGEAGLNLIELGAGDGHKTVLLLRELQERNISLEYNPVDISVGAMEALLETLYEEFSKTVETEAIISEYFQGLAWIKSQNNARNFVLFLGSSIGNFSA